MGSGISKQPVVYAVFVCSFLFFRFSYFCLAVSSNFFASGGRRELAVRPHERQPDEYQRGVVRWVGLEAFFSVCVLVPCLLSGTLIEGKKKSVRHRAHFFCFWLVVKVKNVGYSTLLRGPTACLLDRRGKAGRKMFWQG